ncbi:zinc finger, CCHC-type containing protein [Tanacetum coccineum]|uniref:Zinc finger, CCHC-type containing protein n=1 Tax=Tanacetum coccineum TaxID=301880 RepID=A0ABQ4Y921_9ASTR
MAAAMNTWLQICQTKKMRGWNLEDGFQKMAEEDALLAFQHECGDTLKAKYMAEDASSKKFLVSNFTNYKMTDSRPVLEQYNELIGIPGRFTQHKMNMDESIQDDDVAWWVDSGATVHVCKDRCWFKTYESLNDGSIIHMGNESTALVYGRGCVDLRLNIVSDNIGSAFMSTSKLNDSILWHARLGHVHFKRILDMSKDRFCCVYLLHSKDEILDKFKVFKTEVELQQGSLIKRFRTDRGGEYMDTLYFQSVGLSQGFWGEAMLTACYLLNRVPNKRNKGSCKTLPDPKLKTLGERGIECIFVGYVKHSKAFRFYVIEPNDSVAINSIIESRDAIFDEHMFSSIPRPSQRSLVKGTKDYVGSVVSERVTDEIVQQSEPELRKSKRHRTPKDFRPEFQLYLIEGTRDEVSDQHSYCFNVWDDPKTFNEAMKSQDVDLTKESLSSRFSIKDMGEADVILGIRIKHESNGIAISQSHYIKKVLKKFNYSDCTSVSTPLDTCKKLMPNIGLAVSQLEYSRVIGCLMYAMTCTRPDIAFAVGKLSRYTSNPVFKGYTDASWISNTEDNSSISGWVFLLGGNVISWASKKQTYITGSTIESKFLALAAAGKEAEWLKNLLLEIPLWVKPIAPISIRCDSAATLAKAYSQMYSGKSRHLGVRHIMIRELITNRVVSIEFVRSQQNLADHLMKGLARYLVIKSAEGMGLKTEAHVLQIIPKMYLEPADKEDEVDNFSMVNFFEKVLSKSINKEEPPMYGVYTQRSLNTLTLIVVKGIHGFDEVPRIPSGVIRQRKYTQRVNSSEVVSVLNHQWVCSSAGKLMLQDTEGKTLWVEFNVL